MKKSRVNKRIVVPKGTLAKMMEPPPDPNDDGVRKFLANSKGELKRLNEWVSKCSDYDWLREEVDKIVAQIEVLEIAFKIKD